MKRKQHESKEQITVIDYTRFIPEVKDLIYHIPNGGFRNKREAAEFKRMGVRPGVFDLTVPLPIMHRPLTAGECHGLYLEMKYGRNSLSKNQKDFMTRMQAQGYECYECNGAGEAIDILNDYVNRYRQARCE